MHSSVRWGSARCAGVVALLVWGVLVAGHTVHAGTSDNVSGWAWSAEAGWISMNATNCVQLNRGQDPDPCTLQGGIDYGVHITPHGRLIGYAWSRALGWICFGSTCAGSGGATPTGGWEARVNAITGQVRGWAKVLSLGDGGWLSLSCENTRTCGASAYRVTLDIASGPFAGYSWNGAQETSGTRVPAAGWIAFRPTLGGVTTTWNPDPRCTFSGASCSSDENCTLPGELCCLGGAPCGRCGGSGAECGARAECGTGTLCCRSGVACGRCVTDGSSCGSDTACGGLADACCPGGSVCTQRPPRGTTPPTSGGGGGGSGGATSPAPITSSLGFCAASTQPCVTNAQCGGVSACEQPRGICGTSRSVCDPAVGCGGDTCRVDVGICSQNGVDGQGNVRTVVCLADQDCAGLGGGRATCQRQIGLCTLEQRLCVANANCVNANSQCGQLFLPWLQTQYGSVYSGGRVGGPATPPPPAGQFNATYCILAGNSITNFVSGQGCGLVPQTPYLPFGAQTPAEAAAQLLRLDISGIRAGRYGPVTPPPPAPFSSTGFVLGGRTYVMNGDYTIDTAGVTFRNGIGNQRGSGLFVVVGGNLIIRGNTQYEQPTGALTNVQQLASPGWLVLRDASGNGGSVVVDPGVTELVGAFYAEGTIRTGTTGNARTDRPLTVRGVMVARQFAFERQGGAARASERVIADGRALANPPPGFGDLGRATPTIRRTTP